MRRKRRTRSKNDVPGWVVNKEKAKEINDTDLQLLQKKFKGKLIITTMKNGGIVIYPNTQSGRSDDFENFMTDHTPFKKQKIDLRRI